MAQALQNGTTLQDGKYKIVSFLGQGGFGITYLAENTMLDKKVAIKEFFPKDFYDREDPCHLRVGTESNRETVEKLKDRFLKEARNIAKIDFPGIVKIFDIFKENNTSYYVMEYIEGENLNDIVKKNGPLSEEKAIEYIKGVGEALEYIHSKNMTHFDVKPSNIVIRRSDDTPILIDFGLSKQYNKEGEATSTLLRGVSKGYSPIELYNADENLTFSPQTDIYSLAATLYYLLEGVIPPCSLDLVTNHLEFNKPLTEEIKVIITKGMNVKKEFRFFIIKEFLDNISNQRFPYNSEETQIESLVNKVSSEKINIFLILEKAIKGDDDSQAQIKDIFINGFETPDITSFNYSNVLEKIRQAAEGGNPYGMLGLGVIYLEGYGVEKDFNKAILLFEKVAQKSKSMAFVYYLLGYVYYYPEIAEKEKDEIKALEFFHKAAELKVKEAQCFLGLYFFEKEEESKAFEWIYKAANQGEYHSIQILGEMYYNGYGTAIDYSKAVEWYRKAAERGDEDAMNSLGVMYHNGKGVEKDYTEAFNWFLKAAEKNQLTALENIARAYYNGWGVEKDYSKAMEWYKKAAEQGNVSAMNELGDMYYKGKGIEKSLENAKLYWGKAAENGNEKANKKRNFKSYRLWYFYFEDIVLGIWYGFWYCFLFSVVIAVVLLFFVG